MTAISWAANTAAQPLDPILAQLTDWVQLLELPAVLVGLMVSGNVHQPSIVATYLAVFFQWSGLTYLLSFAFAPSARPQIVLRQWRELAMNKLLPNRPRNGAGK
jgi:hypothetical protein